MGQEEHLLELYREKMRDLLRRSVEALDQLTDADVNWRPNEESNSIANLVVHMAGNLQQRLASGIGGAPDSRNRDAEFNDRELHTREQLTAILHASFGMADRVISQLTPDRLAEPQWIRNRQVTVLEVLLTVVTHMSEHIGQILYIAKLRLGPGYKVLSIPHRKA